MMKHIYTRTALLVAALMALAVPVAAQTTVTQTTLSSSLAAPTQTAPARLAIVASATNITVGTELFVDEEAMLVTAVNGTNMTVQRGVDGSTVGGHASGQVVYAGPTSGTTGSPFVFSDPPIGTCTLSNEVYSLRINVTNGRVWQCTNSVWANVVDSYAWIGPGNCYYSTSGGTFVAQTNVGVAGTTPLGLVNSGATLPGTPVMAVSTTNGGTATNTISCMIPVPSRVNTARGVQLVDAVVFYGVGQNAIGSTVNTPQAVTLSSGQLNGVNVFGKITMPAVGLSETPSTVAQARADSGTLAISPDPTNANFNTATTTAGAFYSIKFTPASPISMTTDLTQYYVNLTLLCQATTATTIYEGGVLVHYRFVGDL